MKVRVPNELRPPERFKPFKDPDHIRSYGWFRVAGDFRVPRLGEFYWKPSAEILVQTKFGGIVMESQGVCEHPRVILERVPGSLEPRRIV